MRCHLFQAGDSRAYVAEPDGGLGQLTTDHLRSGGDAMRNLTDDSVMSNCISADTEFSIDHHQVQLQAPFLLLCATDGCFAYVRSPMHFEHLLLSTMQDAQDVPAWQQALEAETTITGDDAAIALLGLGPTSTASSSSSRTGPRRSGVATSTRSTSWTARSTRPSSSWPGCGPAGSSWGRALGDLQGRLRALPGRARAGWRGGTVKAGDVINGYTILEDFRVVGAGLSKWTFAAKDGREYFIKEFLSPTFPDEHAPAAPRPRCASASAVEAFERHHRRINEALAEISGVGGNLIVTLAFFRWGASTTRSPRRSRWPACRRPTPPPCPSRTSWSCSRQWLTACGSCMTAASSTATSSQQRPHQADRAWVHHQADRLRQRLPGRRAAPQARSSGP